MTDDEAALRARGVVRAEMIKRRMTFGDLQRALAQRGNVQNERTLRNRITRGHFSAALMLQCLEAMEIHTIHLDYPGEPIRLTPKPGTDPTDVAVAEEALNMVKRMIESLPIDVQRQMASEYESAMEKDPRKGGGRS